MLWRGRPSVSACAISGDGVAVSFVVLALARVEGPTFGSGLRFRPLRFVRRSGAGQGKKSHRER